MGQSVSSLLPVIYTDLGIQAAAFSISAPLKTEKLYDVSGSLTYAACIGISFLANRNTTIFKHILTRHTRQMIVSGCALLWCTRLGLFLGMQVVK